MSVHSECGREIKWSRREDDHDKWHPPLEFVGQAFIITDDDQAILVNTYKRHECDPEEIKLWLELKRRQAEARGISVVDIDATEERIIARERDRDALNLRGITAACPTCHMADGEMCISLAWMKKGEKRYNKNVHPARLEQAAREQFPE